MSFAPIQIVQMAAGGVAAAGGVWILARRRFGRRPPPKITTSGGDRKISEPTRLTCGLILLLGGYHAIVWALPSYMTAVQLNRKYWYIWILIGLFAAISAIVMDRVDQKNDQPNRDTPA